MKDNDNRPYKLGNYNYSDYENQSIDSIYIGKGINLSWEEQDVLKELL